MSETTLVSETTPLDQPKAARRSRGPNEAELRDAVETWGRVRWPDARVCHELIMGRGTSRLDVAFVTRSALIVVELKSDFDTMERAIHQVAMATLSSNEVWLICAKRWGSDMRLLRYLLPSLGIAEAERTVAGWSVTVLCEAARVTPHPESMASLLWVAELQRALGIGPSSRPDRHFSLVKRIAALGDDVRTGLICRELRARHALWRADPPVVSQDGEELP